MYGADGAKWSRPAALPWRWSPVAGAAELFKKHVGVSAEERTSAIRGRKLDSFCATS